MGEDSVVWAQTHVCAKLAESVSPRTVAMLVRTIYSIAATGLYPSFPPMTPTTAVFTSAYPCRHWSEMPVARISRQVMDSALAEPPLPPIVWMED